MAIRNKRPQAYNNLTKQNEEVIWPSFSVDFDDGANLQQKMKELINEINELKNKDSELLDIIHAPVPVPEQVGILVYNGLVQAPNWSVDSIRIIPSGNLNGINAGNYVARFNLQEGFTWEDGSTGTKESVWRIEPGFVKAEPYIDGFLVENGEVQSMMSILRNYNATDFRLEGNVTFKDAGTYQVWLTPTSNVRWFDGSTETRYLEYKVYTDEEYRNKYLPEAVQRLSENIDTLSSRITTLENTTTVSLDNRIGAIETTSIPGITSQILEIKETTIPNLERELNDLKESVVYHESLTEGE